MVAMVVLMAAMIIAPAVAARQWSHRLEGMVLLAAAIGVAARRTVREVATRRDPSRV